MIPLYDSIPSRHVPIAMWLIILANGVVFAVELALPQPRLEQFIYVFGLIPARFTHPLWGADVAITANSFWPFFTSMFLHGGWLHIILNMWALWVFGNNVEDRMGHVRFLIFYLVCGILSGVIDALVDANSTVPTIGASGAIAGVLGAYFVFFPRAWIIVLFPIFIIPFFFQIPAVLFIGLWFLVQFYGGTMSLLSSSTAAGGIAWWAHVGGFLAGAALSKPFTIGRPEPRETYADEYGAKGAWFRS